jgi:coenzyme F420-reducing hydrogenase alpha subunit
MVMLAAPDFLDVPDVAELAKLHPERVKAALRIKKAGNAIVSTLGGREIHPINVRIGGFYRAPRREELQALLPELVWARSAAMELVDWVTGFPYPDVKNDYLFVALRHPDEYPFNEGRVISSAGLDIDVSDYDAHFSESHEQRSHALHTTQRGATMFCGPLARLALNFDRLPPLALEAASRAGIDPSCRNPFKSLLARGVEAVFALDEAIRVIEHYSPPARSFVPPVWRAGTGFGATEAPRGILYHRYTLKDDGSIADAKIVPPTSQNQRVIEEDLYRMGKMLAALSKNDAKKRAEQAVRNYDPCISCATHFLDLRIERE